MDFEEKRKKYVISHIFASKEMEQKEKMEINIKLKKIKELKLIEKYIEENINFLFNERDNLDVNKSIPVYYITASFIKWCKDNHNFNCLNIKYNLSDVFKGLDYLGPSNSENEWFGISFKNEKYNSTKSSFNFD